MPNAAFTFEPHELVIEQPFTTESGYTFPKLQVRYYVAGSLNADRTNVVWISHALTANANPGDWWPGFWSAECPFQPEEHALICVNVLGSCYGTTGPLTHTIDGPLYHRFPKITVRDMARCFDRVADALDIQSVFTLIGPSLGGQVALEWALMRPDRIERLVAIATNAKHSAWGIAINENQRWAIEQDITWGINTENSGKQGLQLARAIAMTSYRTYEGYVATQDDEVQLEAARRASRYQRYQGQKLSKRFNAISYYRLTQAMDSHDIGRDRDSAIKALQGFHRPVLVVSMEGDILFPESEQAFLVQHLPHAEHVTIPTSFGHDGFLLETRPLQQHLQQFLTYTTTQHVA